MVILFWHGSPIIYNRDDIHPFIKLSYGELYDKTLERNNIIKKLGYNLIIIWENDFYKLEKELIKN